MRKRFHGLKKPKPRQDWSKWTLYNISRMILPTAANKTFFQQKWLAKSMTRAYHGEQIREGQWTRMFDRRLPAVVPMDYRTLARTDGSQQAAGRGSGLDKKALQQEEEEKQRGKDERPRRVLPPAKTPYMHMTYHPTERRLDTAVFRSLFASSTRQARQFVVHGFVKVNGKKMQYPGYLLNPGDMFSVEPERVLYATGARKYRKTSPETLQGAVRDEETDLVVDDDAEDLIEENDDATSAAEAEAEVEESAAAEEIKAEEDPKQTLKALLKRAKSIMADSRDAISAKRKQELRSFGQTAKKALSQIRGTKLNTNTPLDETIEGLEETLNSISAKIPGATTTATADVPTETTTTTSPNSTPTKPTTSSNPQAQSPGKEDLYRSRKDAELLHAALQRAQANPIDVRKPYATPWKPREFMSAFAFIPRYLEVNQKICTAVYLRHPVARPGLAEVPTPFHGETMALAFNWYLRRR
ncbi:hypothetical protein BDV97DRAFT_379126 [Delphinella strobiligena]|nr:hypothetical protein BDV97DRAFT_379126 [Delphinella strobiligena]